MAVEDDAFTDLIQQLRNGSEEAARTLVETYGPLVLRVVRSRLSGLSRRMRSRFDSRDFVQDVYAAFFTALPRADVLVTPDDLVAFLIRLASHRVIDGYRRDLGGKGRNLNREYSLDGSAFVLGRELESATPTPSFQMMAREEWTRFLRRQPAPYRRIAEMRFAGATHEEIAREMNMCERSVRRVIRKLSAQIAMDHKPHAERSE